MAREDYQKLATEIIEGLGGRVVDVKTSTGAHRWLICQFGEKTTRIRVSLKKPGKGCGAANQRTQIKRHIRDLLAC